MVIILALGLIIMAFVGLLVLVVGGLVGAFLGAVIGGITGNIQVPEEGNELATYRGVTWGGCLGTVVGLALALLILILAWNHLLSVNS